MNRHDEENTGTVKHGLQDPKCRNPTVGIAALGFDRWHSKRRPLALKVTPATDGEGVSQSGLSSDDSSWGLSLVFVDRPSLGLSTGVRNENKRQ